MCARDVPPLDIHGILVDVDSILLHSLLILPGCTGHHGARYHLACAVLSLCCPRKGAWANSNVEHVRMQALRKNSDVLGSDLLHVCTERLAYTCV